jgi:DNA-binding LacI/PurR family transcriptional regulator
MARQRISIHDVARKAEVSVSAVSHAFNRPDELSVEVRERILRLAQELGYRPDPRARGLRRGESTLIALVVADIVNSFNAALVHRVQHTVAAQGFHLVILGSNTSSDEIRSLQAVHYERLAGAIVPAYHLEPNEVLHHVGDRPVVFITDTAVTCDAPAVRIPNGEAAYKATSLLAEQGRRRIATIAGRTHTLPGARRQAGYEQALADLDLGPPHAACGNFEFLGGREAMAELLASPNPPDAVFAANDPMALGALSLLRERGVMVPDDIAIVGFDNLPEASWSAPPLTTLDHPAGEIGATAATLFLSLLRDPGFRRTVEMPCTLVRRASA